MSLSVSTQVNPVGAKLVQQTSATSTPDVNVTGSSTTVYMIDIDNSSNSSASYVKFYDSSPTVGTTAPVEIVRVPASQQRVRVITEGSDYSMLSFACVTTPGNSGTTSPTNPVIIRIVCS